MSTHSQMIHRWVERKFRRVFSVTQSTPIRLIKPNCVTVRKTGTSRMNIAVYSRLLHSTRPPYQHNHAEWQNVPLSFLNHLEGMNTAHSKHKTVPDCVHWPRSRIHWVLFAAVVLCPLALYLPSQKSQRCIKSWQQTQLCGSRTETYSRLAWNLFGGCFHPR